MFQGICGRRLGGQSSNKGNTDSIVPSRVQGLRMTGPFDSDINIKYTFFPPRLWNRTYFLVTFCKLKENNERRQ